MEDSAVRFGILGPLRAWRGDHALSLGPGKQRAVLAVLLIEANRPVSPARIVEAVWRNDPPANGTNVVQKYVAGLRQVLEPDRPPRSSGRLLSLTEAGYRLSVAPGHLDAEAFDERVRRARLRAAEGRYDAAVEDVEAALQLWQAEPLAGLDGPVFASARDRFREWHAAALELWVDLHLKLGRHDSVLPDLGRLVADYPLRERLRYLQMLALYRCGRQAEALAAYRDIRERLVEEIGIEPGDSLQQLHQQILGADPALLAPVRGAAQPEAHPEPAADVVDGVVDEPMRPMVALPVGVGPDAAARRRRRRLAAVALTAVPLLTFGLATWAVMAVVAALRRQPWLWLASIGYLACTVTFFVAVDGPEPLGTTRDAIAVVAALVPFIGGTAHGLWLALSAPAASSGIRQRAIGDEAQRRLAREFARQHPAAARGVGVGRPDLPRQYADGGLVDINEAPFRVIANVPGITRDQAAVIVGYRQQQGRFTSVDDLVTRRIMPAPLPEELRDRLIVIPHTDGR